MAIGVPISTCLQRVPSQEQAGARIVIAVTQQLETRIRILLVKGSSREAKWASW